MNWTASLFAPLRGLAVAVLGLACGTAQAGGILTVSTVGFGGACDFADLQAAINAASTAAADSTVIRLSRDFSVATVQVIDRNLTIDGRWPSCGSTLPQAGLQHALTGNGLDSVFVATTTGASARTLVLNGMVVRGGGADDALNERGGGLRISGRVAATILRSSISNNVSIQGGGIAVEGAFASLVLDDNSFVGLDGGNPANGASGIGPAFGLGGGIFCSGGQVTLIDARVRGNGASDDGGGIYLDNCDFTIEPRADFIAQVSSALVQQNQAAGNGGGIYAGGGSNVFWRSQPVGSYAGRAVGNTATGRGGAVFLTGASNFVGDWIRAEDNRADGRGGAYAVQGGSNLILRGGEGYRCTTTNCPGIFGTRGITVGETATLVGGAIYADSNGTVDLRQQQLFDNSANNGSAIHLSGSGTRADLHSVLVARNVLYGVGNGTSTIELTSSADATLRHVTMAGNFRASNQFPGLEQTASSIRANGAASTLELRNSILWNDASVVLRLLAGASSSGSCVFAHEAASFPPATVLDPLYVDTTGSSPDYSLATGSPAIDECAASGANEVDLFGAIRPQDLPGVGGGAGAFDAGAIEVLRDFLLSDGFEDPPLP